MTETGEINNIKDIDCLLDGENDTFSMLEKAHIRLKGEEKRKNKEELTSLMNTFSTKHTTTPEDKFWQVEDVEDVKDTDDTDDTDDNLEYLSETLPSSVTILHVNNLVINISK